MSPLQWFNTCTIPGVSQHERTSLFSEGEAWLLFRLAALGEAVGWSVLIIGIALKYGLLHGNDVPVRIAGSIHGGLFLFYGVIAAVTYPSLGWSRAKASVALAASMPPFGSLVFERIAAHIRWVRQARQHRRVYAWAIIRHNDQLLVLRPVDNARYQLPGGPVSAEHSVAAELAKQVFAQTGVQPQIGQITRVCERRDGRTACIDMCFIVTNPHDFSAGAIQQYLLSQAAYDDSGYSQLPHPSGLTPRWLEHADITDLTITPKSVLPDTVSPDQASTAYSSSNIKIEPARNRRR